MTTAWERLSKPRRELLWKMDYCRRYLERFPKLELVREQHIPYLHNPNVDTMFLLKKRNADLSGGETV